MLIEPIIGAEPAAGSPEGVIVSEIAPLTADAPSLFTNPVMS